MVRQILYLFYQQSFLADDCYSLMEHTSSETFKHLHLTWLAVILFLTLGESSCLIQCQIYIAEKLQELNDVDPFEDMVGSHL
jgi:hypothetical protein